MDHDQLLKKLLKRFFADFMEQFFPAWAVKFDFTSIEWVDKEVFSPGPDGDRHLLDLVAKTRLRDPDPAAPEAGASLVAIHVEIESADRTTRLGARMPSYYVHLRETHGLPVLPVILYTNVGLDGLGRSSFVERVAGEVVAEFHYWYVGLPALDAMAYAEGEGVVGAVLSPLMRTQPDQAVQIGVTAIRQVATASLTDADRELLADVIKAYMPADEATNQAFRALLDTENYREAKAMGLTFREEGQLQGRQEGRLEGVRLAISAVLEVKFGGAGVAFAERLSDVTDAAKLHEILSQAKRASSLDDLVPCVT